MTTNISISELSHRGWTHYYNHENTRTHSTHPDGSMLTCHSNGRVKTDYHARTRWTDHYDPTQTLTHTTHPSGNHTTCHPNGVQKSQFHTSGWTVYTTDRYLRTLGLHTDGSMLTFNENGNCTRQFDASTGWTNHYDDTIGKHINTRDDDPYTQCGRTHTAHDTINHKLDFFTNPYWRVCAVHTTGSSLRCHNNGARGVQTNRITGWTTRYNEHDQRTYSTHGNGDIMSFNISGTRAVHIGIASGWSTYYNKHGTRTHATNITGETAVFDITGAHSTHDHTHSRAPGVDTPVPDCENHDPSVPSSIYEPALVAVVLH